MTTLIRKSGSNSLQKALVTSSSSVKNEMTTCEYRWVNKTIFGDVFSVKVSLKNIHCFQLSKLLIIQTNFSSLTKSIYLRFNYSCFSSLR